MVDCTPRTATADSHTPSQPTRSRSLTRPSFTPFTTTTRVHTHPVVHRAPGTKCGTTILAIDSTIDRTSVDGSNQFRHERTRKYNNWKANIEGNVGESEYLRRTAVTRLDVNQADRETLLSVIDEWKRGCQLAVDAAWEVCHTRSDVQQLAYDDIRERTDLGSQHAVLATHQAAEAIKRAMTAEEGG